MSDVQVKITVPASVLEQLAAIKDNDDYQKNQVIAEWLQSQVDTECEILNALEDLEGV